jgi:hypothetical protein
MGVLARAYTSSGAFGSRYSRVIFALFFVRIAFSRSVTFKRDRNADASQLGPCAAVHTHDGSEFGSTSVFEIERI